MSKVNMLYYLYHKPTTKRILKLQYSCESAIHWIYMKVMRSYQVPRELTYESFIETYGKVPAVVPNADDFECRIPAKRHSMFVRTMRNQLRPANNAEESTTDSSDSNNNDIQREEANQNQIRKDSDAQRMSSPAFRKLKKISLRKKDSKPTEKKAAALQRSQSVSFLAKTSTKPNGWLSTISPSFYRKPDRKGAASGVPQVPMSKMNSAAHCGYLSKRNEKRQTWERFWCILQDTCLYCYASDRAEFADDILALGGYYIITKVGHGKSPETIALERPGKDSYELKGDSQQEQNEWVKALRKNIVSGKRGSVKITRSASSAAACVAPKKLVPARVHKCHSELDVNVNEVKAKLLREVLAQQEEILREKRMLERLVSNNQRGCSPVVIQKHGKTSSMSSLAQSEDNGYCSSLDGSMQDAIYECEPESQSRSYRSMSTVSVASSSSLCSIAEERRRKSVNVCPKVLAEIEEFRAFSKLTIERKASNEM